MVVWLELTELVLLVLQYIYQHIEFVLVLVQVQHICQHSGHWLVVH